MTVIPNEANESFFFFICKISAGKGFKVQIMIKALKKTRTWLLGGLLTLLGFSSCEKPRPDMYGPPLVMYGPPENSYQTRSHGDDSLRDELAGSVTPEVVVPEEE